MNTQIGKDYHLGHLFRECMLQDPEAICQIDAATGAQESRRSVLARATALATALRVAGLQPGDPLALAGRNHLDLHIPYYAALLNGYPICGVDPYFKYDKIKLLFSQLEPKVAFCQESSCRDFRRAADELGLRIRIVTFDGGEDTMAELIRQHPTTESKINEFKVAEFDTDKFYAWLVSTSGSSGVPKLAAMKHAAVVSMIKTFQAMNSTKSVTPALHLSTVQWVSSFFNAIGMPAQNQIKVQTSAPPPLTTEHVIDIINKYRPVVVLSPPVLMHRVLQHEKPCDLTCFDAILLSGATVDKHFLVQLRAALRPDAVALEAYGQSENLIPVLQPLPTAPFGSCGVEYPLVRVKLVEPVTGETITQPNVPGELWTQGPSFTEYYKNPEKTAEALTPDGWYRTGDLLRKDENGFYYFVERIDMLITCGLQRIVPSEVEAVILSHDCVKDVCVTSVPHPVDHEWPVAVVVRKPGAAVSAQEIKDLVTSEVSVQLRGGVLFVAELPTTSTGKLARADVKQLVNDAHAQLE